MNIIDICIGCSKKKSDLGPLMSIRKRLTTPHNIHTWKGISVSQKNSPSIFIYVYINYPN